MMVATTSGLLRCVNELEESVCADPAHNAKVVRIAAYKSREADFGE